MFMLQNIYFAKKIRTYVLSKKIEKLFSGLNQSIICFKRNHLRIIISDFWVCYFYYITHVQNKM